MQPLVRSAVGWSYSGRETPALTLPAAAPLHSNIGKVLDGAAVVQLQREQRHGTAGTTAVSRCCGVGQSAVSRLGSGGPALQAAALPGHRAEKRFQSYQELLKMPKMPLKAPLAFFDNSLSQNEDYEDEELIELTANFDDDSLEDDDDATVDSWNTADLEEQEREEKRREKYFNIYKVTWLANICFHG